MRVFIYYKTFGGETMHEPAEVGLTVRGQYADTSLSVQVNDPATTATGEVPEEDPSKVREVFSGRTKTYENRLFTAKIPEEWEVTSGQADLVCDVLTEPTGTRGMWNSIQVRETEWDDAWMQEQYQDYRNTGYEEGTEVSLTSATFGGEDAWVMDVHAGIGIAARVWAVRSPDGTGVLLEFDSVEQTGPLDFSLIDEVMEEFLDSLEWK